MKTIIGNRILRVENYPRFRLFNGKKYKRGDSVFIHKDAAKIVADVLRTVDGYSVRVVEVEKGIWIVYHRLEK